MSALIENTNQASRSLSKHKGGVLLGQSIEDALLNDKPIIVCISNAAIECRNTLCPDDYSIDENYLHLNYDSFELHINLDETEIKNINEDFICEYHGMEVRLYFFD